MPFSQLPSEYRKIIILLGAALCLFGWSYYFVQRENIQLRQEIQQLVTDAECR